MKAVTELFPLGLDKTVGILAQLERHTIRVYPQQCSRVRHRRSLCNRCADACPTHAIHYNESLQVDFDQCVNCGICATVCPTGALEAQSPTDLQLLDHIKRCIAENHSVTFACPKYLETTKTQLDEIVPVDCLGRLNESVLLAAIAEGAHSVSLLDGACADCSHAAGRTTAAQTVRTTNALLAAFGVASQISFDSQRLALAESGPTEVVTSQGVSRRAFFDYLARETAKATAITVNTILTNQETEVGSRLPVGKLPARVPSKHQLLLQALHKIGTPVATEWTGGIWAQFGYTEKCNGCQACAFFCPTGALTKLEQAGKAGVAFKSSLCTHCGLCEEICYLKAVALSSSIDLAKLRNDTADTLLMRDATTTTLNQLSEEKLKQILKSTFKES